jgi:hypothetical protein
VDSCHHHSLAAADAVCRMKGKCYMLCRLNQRLAVVGWHMNLASPRVQFGVHCMYKDCSSDTVICASSSGDRLYTKLKINPNYVLCSVD